MSPLNSGGEPKHESPAHSGGEPKHEPPAPSGTEPTHEPPAPTGADPKHEPPAPSVADPRHEPPAEAPAAPTTEAPPQPAPDASPEPGNGQLPCFLTSAGLICPGPPDCTVTSTGVTCASNCVLTSAGLTCPRGDVGPNPPRGRVLPNPPVSGERERSSPPRAKVNAERESGIGPRNVADVRDTEAGEQRSTDARDLPFSGFAILLPFGIGCAFLVGGMLLRRPRSAVAGGAELFGDVAPAAALPAQSPRTRTAKPPSRGAIMLQSVILLACGLLLRRRRRR